MIRLSNAKTHSYRDGKWKEFNKFAILIAEGYYVNNRKQGVWKEYYDHTGSVMIEQHYDNGIRHGRFASYHPNGQLFSEGTFNRGLREGYFRVYNEHGRNIRNLLFIHDNQIEDIEVPQEINEEQRREAT
jgi:antitoxin component YwqK of YwqJK toxin-antitoxin module